MYWYMFRRHVACCGHKQDGAIAERHNPLCYALAKCLFSNERNTSSVMQRTCQQLACTGCAIVHQHNLQSM